MSMIGSLSRLKSPIRTRSRESEKSDKSLSEPSNSLYESYRKKESEIIFDSDIEQIGSDPYHSIEGKIDKMPNVLSRINSWLGGSQDIVMTPINKEKKRFGSPRIFSKSPRKLSPPKVEGNNFYKVIGKITQCRYKNGYRETIFKCAQECKAYYCKDGKNRSIYFNENSHDLDICLLFQTYGAARLFQNSLELLRNRPEYSRRVNFEKRIFEEYHVNGFAMPEPVSTDDYEFDEENDSMPFLSVENILDSDTNEEYIEIKYPNVELEQDHKGNQEQQSSQVLSNDTEKKSSIRLDSFRLNSLRMVGRTESFATTSVNDDDSLSVRSIRSLNSAPAQIGRSYENFSPSIRSKSPIRQPSIQRIDSEPIRTLKSLENLSSNPKLKCYSCLFIPKSIDTSYIDDPDNSIYGTWLFRQYFEGLINDFEIPELVIKYIGRDEDVCKATETMDNRVRVQVVIIFRDETLSKAFSRQFKSGTTKISELSYQSYLYANDEKKLEYFMNDRYHRTMNMWNKKDTVEIVDATAVSPTGFGDDMF